jgi:hypothetical protein
LQRRPRQIDKFYPATSEHNCPAHRGASVRSIDWPLTRGGLTARAKAYPPIACEVPASAELSCLSADATGCTIEYSGGTDDRHSLRHECFKALVFLVRPRPLIHPHFCLALAWWMQLAGEPANGVRLHGIGRNDLVLYGVALGTFELAILKTHGTRAGARKHHAQRAVRTSRALNWNEGWAGGKIGLWHDISLHSGGSVQHSLSPMDAEGGAVMEPGCRNALPAGGQYCSHSKRING